MKMLSFRASTMTVLVDFDGTIITDAGDLLFAELGLDGWAANLRSDYALRPDVVAVITTLFNSGHRLILWTNRGPEQREATLANLGELVSLFTDFVFGDGRKRNCVPLGVDLVIDNETRNRLPGVGFLKV